MSVLVAYTRPLFTQGEIAQIEKRRKRDRSSLLAPLSLTADAVFRLTRSDKPSMMNAMHRISVARLPDDGPTAVLTTTPGRPSMIGCSPMTLDMASVWMSTVIRFSVLAPVVVIAMVVPPRVSAIMPVGVIKREIGVVWMVAIMMSVPKVNVNLYPAGLRQARDNQPARDQG
ncbi:MAG: hypothetical protein ACE5LB_08430 [Acidiferrobacterales bacterium]